jgi:DNA-binding CsgD family transcriptional regulator
VREAVKRFDHSIAVSAEVGDPGTRGLVEGWRAYALARLGDIAACRVQATECLTRTVRQGGGLGGTFARVSLGVADLWEGKLESAATTLADAAAISRSTGDTFSSEWALPLAGQALVESGRLDEAAAMLAAARQVAGAPIDNAWSASLALYGQGLLAAARGDAVGAEHQFHQALAVQHQRGFAADAVTTLDELGLLAARAHSWAEAARLLGATEELATSIGLVRSAPRQAARSNAEAEVRSQMGDAFEAAHGEGRRLSLDEVVAYAARARGARGRPLHGWNSLTPTELRVVACVAEGLTNPQIGARLFMSRPTVKTHLSHVFAKLDITTRAELAASAARHGAVSHRAEGLSH